MISLAGLITVLLMPDLAQTSAIQAKAVLDRGIQAQGGLAQLQNIRDITRNFEGVFTNPGQGLRPETPASNPLKLVSIRDMQHQRMLESMESTRPGAPDQRSTQVALADGGFAYLPARKILAKLPPAAGPVFRGRLQRRHPEGLLLSAVAHVESLRFLGNDTFEGKAQKAISYSDSDGATVTLYFDAATGLLTKSAMVSDDPVLGDIATEEIFSDYAEESGLKLPHHYQELTGGAVTQDLRLVSIHINTSPADSLFSSPEGYELLSTTPSQGTLKMADNIYLVQGGYNSMFAVFPDYVVVLEGPSSNNVSDLVIREINKVAPGKPVKYVVVTHFHYDHISGIRRWIAEGATLVCTPTARQVIERAAAAEHHLHPDALSLKPKAPAFEVVQGKTRVFEGGGVRLEVRDISPMTHVSEMLVGLFPQEHVLYEADQINSLVNGKILPTPATAELLQKIDGWGVDKIVEVHGQHVMTFAEAKAAAERMLF